MSDELTYGLALIGVLMIIFALRSMGRKRQKKTYSRDSARDHVDRARQKQGVRDELEALMVDINRMAKDLGAQLDAKIVRIEQASREADERIAQLEALKQTLAQPGAVSPPSRPAAAPGSNPASNDGASATTDSAATPADLATTPASSRAACRCGTLKVLLDI